MNVLLRSKNFYIMVVMDAVLVMASYYLAYFLRFEGLIPSGEWQGVQSSISYILPFKLLIFITFGLYRGMWRYTGLVDLFNVLKATAISSGGIILFILFVNRFQGYPRSIFAIDWVLTFIFVGGIRVVIRVLLSKKEGDEDTRGVHFGSGSQGPRHGFSG
jgi:FlaA1/EpsC-like NDP-sugar epimerase